ncbi:HNH endonuclease [Phaeobacter marinintestinus]|uniref:HNH endonuclease n=1 Tax=Falsiphaeobacter marinintestinus TaxID=1492905 RepID=UPI0011B3800E|nr:HNH endonuclease signature motif containing protein [Phaeobacter marinintestinus]
MGVGRTILDHAAWYRDTREAVALSAGFLCQSCKRYIGMHGEADHIIPRAQCEAHGLSEYDRSNLQWLCKSCHSKKSNAERWEGKRRKGPKPIKRSNVPGRKLFLAMAGIPPDGKGQPP